MLAVDLQRESPHIALFRPFALMQSVVAERVEQVRRMPDLFASKCSRSYMNDCLLVFPEKLNFICSTRCIQVALDDVMG